MDFLTRLLVRLRDATVWLIRRVQWVVMAVSLFLLYFLGVGLTALLGRALRLHGMRWDPPGQASYWHSAEGYEVDPARARHQT